MAALCFSTVTAKEFRKLKIIFLKLHSGGILKFNAANFFVLTNNQLFICLVN